MDQNLNLSVHGSIAEVDRKAYNRIVDRENPFLEYEFLEALERSGAVGPRTSWIPRYLTLSEGSAIVGAVTCYKKLDSYGEYIFDWEWARAFENAALAYYPKLVVAVPFTPATGTRILTHPDYSFEKAAERLVDGLVELSLQEQCSSVHVLYLTERENKFLQNRGFLTRKTHQYHWHNRGYSTFDDFLSDIRSGRKKQIRKERRSIEQSGLQIEIIEKEAVREEHIEAIWEFYCDTHSRKWGSAYLNKEFFDLMYENFRDHLVLVLARERDRWVGGTFNIVKNNRLFGRYWGSIHRYDNLHFECCFYGLIDYSIKKGIDIFEAGAQGEHKFLRGFAAVPTYSSHLIFHKGASDAIENYLVRETEYIENLINQYNSQSPLKYLYGK